MGQGGNISKDLLPDSMFAEDAEKNVKLGLVLREGIKHFSLELDKELVQNRIREMAESYDKPEEFIAQAAASQQYMNHFESLALEEQLAEKLLSEASVTEETVSLDELNDK